MRRYVYEIISGIVYFKEMLVWIPFFVEASDIAIMA
jgi:hypothetical protein